MSYQSNIKEGDLVKLYSLYEAHIEKPSVIGVFLGEGRSGQFAYYEILVLEENLWSSRGGGTAFKERYLASDFFMCGIKENIKERQ